MKSKALFISSRPLVPVIGGDQIRTTQQLQLLQEKCLVDVLYICPVYNADHDRQLKAIYPNVGDIFHVVIGKLRHYLDTLMFIFNRQPIQVNYYYDRVVQKLIDEIIDNYDLVFCNNIRTAQYVIGKKDKTKVIDFVDAISLNYSKAYKKSRGLMRLIYKIDAKRCLKYERRCLEEFDSCSTISEVDADYILHHLL